MAVKKVRTLKQAQNAAREGRIDEALPVFESQLAKGKVPACVALAQISAFRGEWEKVLQYAALLLENPGEIPLLNSWEEMIALLVLAAKKIDDWPRISKKMKEIRSRFEENTTGDNWFITRCRKEYDEITVWTQREGVPQESNKKRTPFTPAENQLAGFEKLKADLGELDTVGKKWTLLNRAVLIGFDQEAIKLYEKSPGIADFDSAFFVSTAYGRAGKPEKARDLLRNKIQRWFTPDISLIMPPKILTHPDLAGVLTPEQCEEALRMPKCLE